jgi:hypothetical protein
VIVRTSHSDFVGDAWSHSRSMPARSGRDLSSGGPDSNRVRFDVSMTNAIRQLKRREEGAESGGAERALDPEVMRGASLEAFVPARELFLRDRSGIGEWIAGIRRSTRPWRRVIGNWVHAGGPRAEKQETGKRKYGSDVDDRRGAKTGDDPAG